MNETDHEIVLLLPSPTAGWRKNPPSSPFKNPKTGATEYYDKLGNLHNENGPAYLTETYTHFMSHGEDWTDEEYETFIRNKTKEIHPELINVPLSQLASIIHATEGWGARKPSPIPLNWGDILGLDES